MVIESLPRALLMARLNRVRDTMTRLAVPALVIVDPVNIQYATGARNMTIFSTRSTSRYLLLFAEGPVILFEYMGCEHLAAHLPTIDDIRPATGVSYTAAGPRVPEAADRWIAEIGTLLRERLEPKSRVAIDRLDYAAIDRLRAQGWRLTDADVVMSEARRVKLPEELPVIRRSIAVVERAARELADAVRPGRSETEIWAVFHRGLIERGGEYVSTRLLAGGPRTFPYFTECGDHRLSDGDLLCFDTDALGVMGYAVDFSRTFHCGDRRPSPEQQHLYRLAREQVEWNVGLFQAGASYREIAERAWPIPDAHRATSYYCIAHGLGMSGEFPNVPHFKPGAPYPLEGHIEPGMMFCIESYIGSAERGEGVKLEDQILITERGPERLTLFPFDARLQPREL